MGEIRRISVAGQIDVARRVQGQGVGRIIFTTTEIGGKDQPAACRVELRDEAIVAGRGRLRERGLWRYREIARACLLR